MRGRKKKTRTDESAPKYLVVARGMIVRDGKVLLLQRSKDHTYYPLKWELPGRRFLGAEDLAETLERGINEETGLVVEGISHGYYCQSRYVTEDGKYQGHVYIEISAEVRYLAGEVKISDEHIGFEWVELHSVFSYDLTVESKKTLTEYVSDIRNESTRLESRLPVLVSARAIIRNEKKEYLLLRRTKGDSFGSQWDLPGGKLSSLEVLNELLKREVFEETGLVIQVDEPALYINSQVLNQGKYAGYTFINLISSAHIVAGEISLSEEHEKYGWFKTEEIFKLNLAPHIKLPLTEILLKR